MILYLCIVLIFSLFYSSFYFFFLFLFTSITSSFLCFVFFFKQKTPYELLISDWRSDVCSSDLRAWLLYRCSGERKSPRPRRGRNSPARRRSCHGSRRHRRSDNSVSTLGQRLDRALPALFSVDDLSRLGRAIWFVPRWPGSPYRR